MIPNQQTGTETNTESSLEVSSLTKAIELFHQVKDRLLHINQWHDMAGAATAKFQLTDYKGNDVDRPAIKGDYIKIDIPGPGTVTGDGNDWVQIEAVEEMKENFRELFFIRVRPAPNPHNKQEDVAHFFTEESTSLFVVCRENTKVIAGVYGRNEKPNLKTEKVVDKIRNTAVATGALSGLAKLQWKSLVDGLLHVDARK